MVRTAVGGTEVFTKGEISVWQPPERFRFEWRGVNFAPGESFGLRPEVAQQTVRKAACARLRRDSPGEPDSGNPHVYRGEKETRAHL